VFLVKKNNVFLIEILCFDDSGPQIRSSP